LRRDLYAGISDLEVFLHRKIKDRLIEEFGETELEWWRLGVPEPIRISCVTRREVDPYTPNESYGYTTFIDLWKIMEKNWQLFHFILPSEMASDRKALSKIFNRLNAIRTYVPRSV